MEKKNNPELRLFGEEKYELERVMESLNEFPNESREAVLLYLSGHTITEIAFITQVKPEIVKEILNMFIRYISR